MAEKLNINQWAEEDRPREKMMLHGVSALSNAELLAILIGSGNTEDSAVEQMRKVLNDYHNNLSELGKASIDELCRFKGIGPAKAITILAASECMNIRFVDHVIFTDGAFYSYADEGRI